MHHPQSLSTPPLCPQRHRLLPRRHPLNLLYLGWLSCSISEVRDFPSSTKPFALSRPLSPASIAAAWASHFAWPVFSCSSFRFGVCWQWSAAVGSTCSADSFRCLFRQREPAPSIAQVRLFRHQEQPLKCCWRLARPKQCRVWGVWFVQLIQWAATRTPWWSQDFSSRRLSCRLREQLDWRCFLNHFVHCLFHLLKCQRNLYASEHWIYATS